MKRTEKKSSRSLKNNWNNRLLKQSVTNFLSINLSALTKSFLESVKSRSFTPSLVVDRDSASSRANTPASEASLNLWNRKWSCSSIRGKILPSPRGCIDCLILMDVILYQDQEQRPWISFYCYDHYIWVSNFLEGTLCSLKLIGRDDASTRPPVSRLDIKSVLMWFCRPSLRLWRR